MSKFGKRLDGPRGRRRAERKKLRLAASVDTIGCTTHVTLHDVSASGAKLSGSNLPPTGRQILLRTAGLTFFGDVVWVTELECGVKFDEPIGDFEIAALNRQGRSLAFLQLTPDEKQAADDWVGGLAR